MRRKEIKMRKGKRLRKDEKRNKRKRDRSDFHKLTAIRPGQEI